MQLSTIDTGQGPPAVLLHGQPGNAGDWHAVTERLRSDMRVIAPDRPGYGRTGGHAMGFHHNALAVLELLDRLEIDSAVVVGHSWATGVALAVAASAPERVRALVLAAPVAPGVPPGLLDRALADTASGPALARVGFRIAGFGLSVPGVREVARRAVPALPSDQVAATAAQWRSDGVWRAFYVEQRAFVNELPQMEREVRAVGHAATVLHGTRDLITPSTHVRRLMELLPRAQLVRADRAGHMLPQQRPELVAEAILRCA